MVFRSFKRLDTISRGLDMSEFTKEFDDRIARIARKHAGRRDGYVGQVNRDGLIVFRPRRRSLSVSPRGVALVVFAFIFFKALIMSHLGFALYHDRIETLRSGSLVEQAGAFVMQPDPATLWLADKMRPYLH
jgi:hypothetical protein